MLNSGCLCLQAARRLRPDHPESDSHPPVQVDCQPSTGLAPTECQAKADPLDFGISTMRCPAQNHSMSLFVIGSAAAEDI